MKKIFLFALILASLGCSRLDMVARWADVTAVSRADKYFDLTSAQEKELKKDLQQDINRLRKELLPEVAKSLRELEPEIKNGHMNPALLAKNFMLVQDYLKKGAAYFKNTAAKTAAQLKKDQFTYFATKVRADIEESKQDNDTADKALRTTYKRYRRSVEFWIGGISAKQQEELESFLKAHPYPWDLQNKSREYSLKLFLDSRQNPEALKKFVLDYYTDYESSRLPEFTDALNAHKYAFQIFLAEKFWKGLSPEQKENLQENLIARAEDLEKIAQRP
ncbi:DUF6279 family lipoprotein [Bdellovibrio bacteriovorus]|uniref:DUF6279 family lipoprotein n=1 Tax=Bdellovibrio bacteriovorus TaxID=959 RepID=UPI0021CECA32|nr:DUF6279 family lipoprotein [Bdellovibrio bacteriovorus]UXR66193.1 DUF6279 family lipoprotein [Bdellovibrio bacteriovorus]